MMKLLIPATALYLFGIGGLAVDNQSIWALATAAIGGAILAGSAIRTEMSSG